MFWVEGKGLGRQTKVLFKSPNPRFDVFSVILQEFEGVMVRSSQLMLDRLYREIEMANDLFLPCFDCSMELSKISNSSGGLWVARLDGQSESATLRFRFSPRNASPSEFDTFRKRFAFFLFAKRKYQIYTAAEHPDSACCLPLEAIFWYNEKNSCSTLLCYRDAPGRKLVW